jgi:hypothetical protein
VPWVTFQTPSGDIRRVEGLIFCHDGTSFASEHNGGLAGIVRAQPRRFER